ncbi:dihydropteroate synthase [Cohnella luojiensis]|uniref:Dihydropteroate synthase n=1 Tax=Cohnella luojiensis TaxID=652876 RepID=A0A4Y8LT16_9BACL|nr:dihydropteroate synthase [Cohnella luojiensis]TFE24100.1 dihydropteroate synthase [Cohnella luojiensis]
MNPTFYSRKYRLQGGLELELGRRTLIMGILNATPDSFSDGGRFDEVAAAVERAKQMEAEGADIIDIGGESTRPGHDPVPLEEELRRIIPVIKAVREQVNLPISVDTYKAETARQALEAGAHIVNDVWGFKRDPELAGVAARFGCPVILTHNRDNRDYRDFISDVLEDLMASVRLALAAGVSEEHIWLDPGIGFAKNYDENLELMGRLSDVAGLGYPVLLGTSRKTFIRRTLDVTAEDAVEGTGATTALGIAQGCQIVRVHDVLQMKRVAAMTDAIVYRHGMKGRT